MIIQAGAALPSRRATIKDVARELEISVATVSRALSKPHLLRPATVARVREAVDLVQPHFEKLPHPPARSRNPYPVVPSGDQIFPARRSGRHSCGGNARSRDD